MEKNGLLVPAGRLCGTSFGYASPGLDRPRGMPYLKHLGVGWPRWHGPGGCSLCHSHLPGNRMSSSQPFLAGHRSLEPVTNLLLDNLLVPGAREMAGKMLE